MKTRKSLRDKEIIVSVDIALNKTGVAIMDSHKQVYSTFVLESSRSWKYYKKLDFIYQEFEKVFSYLKTKKPKKIILILEDRLKAGWSGSTLASIEGARVTCYHSFVHTLKNTKIKNEIILYNPGDVKKHFTKKRAAKKEEVYKNALKSNSFIKTYTQEDILDAIYLAVYHIETKIKN